MGAWVGAGRCVAGGRTRVLATVVVGVAWSVRFNPGDAETVRVLVGVAVCVSVSVVVAVTVSVTVGVIVAVPVVPSAATGSGALV